MYIFKECVVLVFIVCCGVLSREFIETIFYINELHRYVKIYPVAMNLIY